MIDSYRHKGLQELHATGKSSKVGAQFQQQCLEIISALWAATNPRDLNQVGFDCHPLRQHKPVRYAIRVNGPWRITFEWSDGHAKRVDLEQYH